VSDVHVRPATDDDLPAIAVLNRAAVPAVGEVTDVQLRRLLDQADPALVATIDDAVVGVLIALGPGADYASPNYRFFADRHPEFVYVDRVAVTSGEQRRGIGALLYRALEDEVGARTPLIGCEVNVRPLNDTSLAFHAALGFEAVGEQETYGGAFRVRLFVKHL
jgi:uncharacterized protein